MTEQDEYKPRRKRRPKRKAGETVRLCARDGCNKRAGEDYETCSFLCTSAMKELKRAENLCRTTGSTELWALAVTYSDALTAYQREYSRVYNAAVEAGITRDQWAVLVNGS